MSLSKLEDFTVQEIIQYLNKKRKYNTINVCQSCTEIVDYELHEIRDTNHGDTYLECENCCSKCVCGEWVNDAVGYLHDECNEYYCNSCHKESNSILQRCDLCRLKFCGDCGGDEDPENYFMCNECKEDCDENINTKEDKQDI